MTRLTLALSIAALLLLAVALGWLLGWLWSRGRARSDAGESAAGLAARLHAAEAARDAAEARLAAGAMDHDAALAEIEKRHAGEVSSLRAELSAAMDALGAARREAAEWRAAYEALEREDRETP